MIDLPDPRFSIVTPTFNMAEAIEGCIESVACQDVPVEHIVIDGGSRDGTIEVLERLAVTWASEPDDGQADALRKGFARATGDVVGWLNADDRLLPGAMAKVQEVFASRDRPDVVFGDILLTGLTEAPRRLSPSARDLDLPALGRGNALFQPGTFFTKALLDVVGGVDTTFHLAMDFELWLRFAKARARSVYIPEPLATFHVHRGSKTGGTPSFEFAWEEARALRQHGEFVAAARALEEWRRSELVERLLREAEDDAAVARRDAISELRDLLGRRTAAIAVAAVAPRALRALRQLRRTPPGLHREAR